MIDWDSIGQGTFFAPNFHVVLLFPPFFFSIFFLIFFSIIFSVDFAKKSGGGVLCIGVVGQSGESVGQRLRGEDDDGENGNDFGISGVTRTDEIGGEDETTGWKGKERRMGTGVMEEGENIVRRGGEE